MLAAVGAVTLGCVAALDGALGVCGWRLGVRARGLGWPMVRLVCVCPAGWAHCGRVVVARVCFRSLSLASVAELVDAPDSKSGIRWGVWVRVPPEVLAPRRKRWSAYKASVVEW